MGTDIWKSRSIWDVQRETMGWNYRAKANESNEQKITGRRLVDVDRVKKRAPSFECHRARTAEKRGWSLKKPWRKPIAEGCQGNRMVPKNRSGRLLSLVVAVARSSNDQAEIFDFLKTKSIYQSGLCPPSNVFSQLGALGLVRLLIVTLPANGDDFHCFKFNYNWFVWLHNYLMLASVTCEASSPPLSLS